MSRLALSHSKNPAVKRLANAMITDHRTLDDRMAAISGLSGIAPQDGDVIRSLGTMFGPQFDQHYIDQMLADHRAAIALFADASRNARTPRTRQFAGKNLPKLRQHLGAVQQTQKSIKRNPRQR